MQLLAAQVRIGAPGVGWRLFIELIGLPLPLDELHHGVDAGVEAARVLVVIVIRHFHGGQVMGKALCDPAPLTDGLAMCLDDGGGVVAGRLDDLRIVAMREIRARTARELGLGGGTNIFGEIPLPAQALGLAANGRFGDAVLGGEVADFLGIADQLRDAVQTYTQAGAVPLMERQYEALWDFFNGLDYSGFSTGDKAVQIRAVTTGADYVFEQDDGKRRFMNMVAGLSKAFSLAVPRPETEAIRDDLAYFQSVRAAIRKRLADDGPPPAPDNRAAVRQVLSGAIASDGVIDLFQVPTPEL